MTKCYKNCANCGYHEHVEPCCKPTPCEHEILCADPVCMRPCWDTCKCMDEILKLKAGEDKTDSNIGQLDGKIDKIEKDVQDATNALTDQMGALAEKEQHDVDCLNKKIDDKFDELDGEIDAEIERATAKEELLQKGLTDEIKRATDAEGKLQDGLNAEIKRSTERDDTLDKAISDEKDRATNAENDLQNKLDAEEKRAKDAEGKIDGKLDQEIDARKRLAIANADYDKSRKLIIFKNNNGDEIDRIEANDFVKDGMVHAVELSGNDLIITWNSDAQTSPTIIDVRRIFDPDNYYTRVEIDLKKIEVDASISEERARAKAKEDDIASDLAAEKQERTSADIVLKADLADANAKIANINNTIAQTSNNNTTLEFGATKTIAKVNAVDITVGLPELPTSIETATKDDKGNVISNTYVSNVGINGDNLTWTKAGTVNEITVPYATKASQDQNGDTIHTTYLKSATAASTYETKANAVTDITLDGDYLVITFGDGHTQNCPLPTGLINVNTIIDTLNEHSDLLAEYKKRIEALEALWKVNPNNSNQLIPVNSSASVAARGFYDTDPNMA